MALFIKRQSVPLTSSHAEVRPLSLHSPNKCIPELYDNVRQYANLKIVDGVSYGDEIFAVGLRKGSNLKAKLDAFLKAKYADGTMTTLALKYNVGLNADALSAK